MKLTSAVNYREDLAESITAAGTSEGAAKAWDTRGRGRRAVEKKGKLKPDSATVKLVKKTTKDMKAMDTDRDPNKRLGAAERSLADVKKLGDQGDMTAKQQAYFDKQAGIAERILQQIKTHPKLSLLDTAAALFSMLQECAHMIHSLFAFVITAAPQIHQAVHGMFQSGMFGSADRQAPFVSLQRNLKLESAVKLVSLR